MNINDTLTKTRIKLDNRNIVTWYMCGPTVYDHAHLGQNIKEQRI